MTYNERLEETLTDIEEHTQLSPSQADRKDFTSGKAYLSDNPASQLAQNWPQEFTVKTGNPVFDNNDGIIHTRVAKTGRLVICDQTIPQPNVLGTEIVNVTGSGYSSETTITETSTQLNNGEQERKTGSEGYDE